jgi:hypothetical protein
VIQYVERRDPAEADRPAVTVPLLLFLGAVVLGLAAARGGFGAKGLSYDFAHQALLIASGRIAETPRDHLMWPPGYPIAMVPLIWLGIPALRAAWFVSIAAFGATVAMTFLLGRRLGSAALGLGTALLLLLNADMLERAAMPLSDMLFTASVLAALLAFDGFYVRWRTDSQEITWGRVVTTSFFLATPTYIKYIGVVVPLLALGSLCVLAFASGKKPAPVAVLVLSAAALVAALPLRNVLLGGSATGHPVGAEPADTLWSAASEALMLLRTMWFFLAERLPRSLVDVATALVLTGVALSGSRRARWVVASWVTVVYLTALCWIASHTRIDKMHDRFLLPIVPVMVLVIWAALTSAIRAPSTGKIIRGAAVTIALIAAIAGGVGMSRGLALLVRGYQPDSDYSPSTIAFVREHVPPGSGLAVSGRQLAAHTLAYREVVMPWTEPGEDNWPKAYGIAPWRRAEALRSFLAEDIHYVVLFLGPSGDYRSLRRAYPGDYIASTLVKERLPEIASVTRLRDGIVIGLADRGHLQDALREAED